VDFLGLKRPVFSDFQGTDFNAADRGAHQLQDFRSQRFHHAAHLAVAPFGDGDFEKTIFGAVANALH